MLTVRKHAELLYAQYLTGCIEPGNVCRSITTRGPHKRRMNGTLLTKHENTVEPVVIANGRKITLHVIHTDAVFKADNSQERYVVLDVRPPPFNKTENGSTMRVHATPAQLETPGLLPE